MRLTDTKLNSGSRSLDESLAAAEPINLLAADLSMDAQHLVAFVADHKPEIWLEVKKYTGANGPHLTRLIWGASDRVEDLFDKNELLVLLAMADYRNNKTGALFPTEASVARKTGLSRRTVSTVKKSLAEKAILTWDRRFNSSNRYEINIPLLALLVSVGKVYEQWVTHTTGVTHVTEGGDEIVGRVGNNCARYGKYCNCERGGCQLTSNKTSKLKQTYIRDPLGANLLSFFEGEEEHKLDASPLQALSPFSQEDVVENGVAWALEKLSGESLDDRQRRMLVATRGHGQAYDEAVNYVLFHLDYAPLRERHCTTHKLVMAINKETLNFQRQATAIGNHNRREAFKKMAEDWGPRPGRNRPSLQDATFRYLAQEGIVNAPEWRTDERGYWISDNSEQIDRVAGSVSTIFNSEDDLEVQFYWGVWTGSEN